MNKIWVFAEQINCTLDRVTLELLSKAKELAGGLKGETEVAAVLLGCGVKNFARFWPITERIRYILRNQKHLSFIIPCSTPL